MFDWPLQSHTSPKSTSSRRVVALPMLVDATIDTGASLAFWALCAQFSFDDKRRRKQNHTNQARDRPMSSQQHTRTYIRTPCHCTSGSERRQMPVSEPVAVAETEVPSILTCKRMQQTNNRALGMRD